MALVDVRSFLTALRTVHPDDDTMNDRIDAMLNMQADRDLTFDDLKKFVFDNFDYMQVSDVLKHMAGQLSNQAAASIIRSKCDGMIETINRGVAARSLLAIRKTRRAPRKIRRKAM